MTLVTTLLPVERFKVPGAVIPRDLEFQFETDREIKNGRYSEARKDCFKQGLREVDGCRLGIVGMGAMPRGSILINTSRGEVVDQKALADAIETGHIDGAAVDTVSPEPPPPDHPLVNFLRESYKYLRPPNAQIFYFGAWS